MSTLLGGVGSSPGRAARSSTADVRRRIPTASWGGAEGAVRRAEGGREGPAPWGEGDGGAPGHVKLRRE
jgi:hypothetical protein